MPHQSDAFEELDVCDDVRESSYYRYRDIKNEFSNFQGTKQAETGTSQFRVSKSRSTPNQIISEFNPNGTNTNTLQSERHVIKKEKKYHF